MGTYIARSASLRGNGSADGALENTTPSTIQTTRFLQGSATAAGGKKYKDSILTATTDGNGNVTFQYASPKDYGDPSSKTNKTAQATFGITHGAVNGKTIGINWAKVNSISGQTYDLRTEAKAAGLKWDSQKKRWQR